MNSIFSQGEPFFVGCNYWASHAGTAMWRDWRPDVVEKDFQLLASHGVQIARVFPLWPDFQPITLHTGGGQCPREMRWGEEPLSDDEFGRAGVDPVMVERFRLLAKLAGEHGIRLIVGLVTGWMSGRMHVPPAFAGVNVITDPDAVRWEVRMVRLLVRKLADLPSIAAWDLGNECNCMAPVERENGSAAWVWSNTIASAVRGEDNSRPVVSGMHSLVCNTGDYAWTISDQAETTDVLCTHPYPLFTPYCAQDPVNTLRNAMHAAAETRLYGDVGNIPAFVEEAGSLGPSQSSDRVAGVYMTNMLWNSYAHDCRGLLWWCAHDQGKLPQTPYDWAGVERELGLIRCSGEPKPTLLAMQSFGETLDRAKLRTLPRFRRDAVAILTLGQDTWAVGYSCFILAKQAGFDIEFQLGTQPLKEAEFYILPSVAGHDPLPRRRYLELLRRVEEGATLLVTSDGGSLQPFNEVFGIDIEYSATAVEPVRIAGCGVDLDCPAPILLKLSSRDAEVLATDGDGDPVFCCRNYGKGKLLFLSVPIEKCTAQTPRAFLPGAPEFYRLYRKAAEVAAVRRCVTRVNPSLTLTEHPVDSETVLVVAVNNTPGELLETLIPASGWRLDEILCGAEASLGQLRFPGNSGAVLRYKRA